MLGGEGEVKIYLCMLSGNGGPFYTLCMHVSYVLFCCSPLSLAVSILLVLLSCSQKLHNVGVALKALSRHTRVPSVVTAQSVVEGHREKTLTLLWTIIFHFKVNAQKEAALTDYINMYAVYLHTVPYIIACS